MTMNHHRAKRVNDFFNDHHLALARQGSVVSSTRVRDGRRFGPYFRIEWRLPSGTKVALYLGSDASLVAAVRTRLAALRRPRSQRQNMAKLYRHPRRGARAARVSLALELGKLGLRLQGSEIRGRSRSKPTTSTALEGSKLEK